MLNSVSFDRNRGRMYKIFLLTDESDHGNMIQLNRFEYSRQFALLKLYVDGMNNFEIELFHVIIVLYQVLVFVVN